MAFIGSENIPGQVQSEKGKTPDACITLSQVLHGKHEGVTVAQEASPSWDLVMTAASQWNYGDWTPAARITVPGGVWNFTTQSGKYHKIGNLVTVGFSLVGTISAGTGILEIYNLPFEANVAFAVSGGAMIHHAGVAYDPNYASPGDFSLCAAGQGITDRLCFVIRSNGTQIYSDAGEALVTVDGSVAAQTIAAHGIFQYFTV